MKNTKSFDPRSILPSIFVTAAILAGARIWETNHQPDPLTQASFPCQEDKALVFAPQFGPDRTGCISKDTAP